ncbi:TPA: hypothetical protein DIC20_03735 [Candidatus Dependentiae bacterium]|nr:hypothetical protein [Candidatus Dependentiae bacterium]HCU00787.1 hypothetical protein [Candidatus Dependentiae bacterium]
MKKLLCLALLVGCTGLKAVSYEDVNLKIQKMYGNLADQYAIFHRNIVGMSVGAGKLTLRNGTTADDLLSNLNVLERLINRFSEEAIPASEMIKIISSRS